MWKKMKKHLKNEKGLTLIELLAVIVILAIISAIAIPAVSSIIAKQEDKAVLADAVRIINSAKLAHTDGACSENTTPDTTNNTTTKKITCTDTNIGDYLEMQTGKKFIGEVTKTTTKASTGETTGEWTLLWKGSEKGDTTPPVINKIKLNGTTDINLTSITESNVLKAMGKK